MSDPGARARRYLLEGDPALALGACEAALDEPLPQRPQPARRARDLALRVLAARAATELGDLGARVVHLEAAEGLARAGGLDALGPVLQQLGEAHLARAEPARAAVALEEALEHLPAESPLRTRVGDALAEARRREAEEDEPEPAPTRGPAPGAPPGPGSERLVAMLEGVLEADPSLDLEALLDLILAELVRAVRGDRGFVLLFEPFERERRLVVRAARDQQGQAVERPEKELSRRIAERAAEESVALRAVRPAEDPRFAGSRSAQALDLRALVAAPLRYRRTDLGCVLIDRRGARDVAFDDEAAALVTRFARLVSGVIVRTRQRETLRRRTATLTDLFARGIAQAHERLQLGALIGRSEEGFRLLRLIERVAPTESRVLIRGESGVGKDLVARTIHEASGRGEGPFLSVGCASLTESLLTSELFGHARGAFTGAHDARAGLFERAHGGSLYLDEIADASPGLQAELLRVLETGEVRRVGGNRTRAVDVRILASTHQDLDALVAQGRFREDLLFRLNVLEVLVPPLRRRKGDIVPLAQHFAAEAQERLGAAAFALGDDILRTLESRRWYGNVRELKNAVVRYLTVGELPEPAPPPPEVGGLHLPSAPPVAPEVAPDDEVLTLAEVERRAIAYALRVTEGKRRETAQLLGISRRTLFNKIRAYGLE